MYSNEIELQKERSSITFETILYNYSSDPELTEQLSEANVLIIPYNYGEKYNVFPVGTVELYRYLHKNSPDQVKIDIVTKDDEYLELAQHSDLVTLATIVVSGAIAPVLLGLITNYIYDKMVSKGSRVKSEIIIVNDDGTSTSIKYSGPTAEYHETLYHIFQK